MASTSAPHEVLEPSKIRHVIFASSIGTLFEWYDFYLYGSLAAFFGGLFFPKGHDTAAFLASLATFGAGFAVRPFGALFFGRLGDLVGRKYTFLVTIVIMGVSTAAIGLLPTYEQVGILAPILLVVLRLAQGLALGGEYGGAATYVAEHAPNDQRGYYTSFIQTTATLGFFVSLAVILTTRLSFGDDTFRAWAWRVPFLLSFVLLAISVYIRLKLKESPAFLKLKAANKVSVNPLKESFVNPVNLKYVLIALFGATAGQGVVWYTSQFYALFFLQTTLKVPFVESYILIGIALAIGTPFFVVFGKLSDRIGRKPIILAGCAIAAVGYYPLFLGLSAVATPPNVNYPATLAILVMCMLLVTMVYGPIAAFLVELFPTRIRYTSMSLPYHIGNGVFGGFMPLIATSVTTATGNIYAGLIYPCAVALITVIVGAICIKESKEHRLIDDVDAP